METALNFNPELIQATIIDHPIIQNMGRFYVYDMSRYCGFISEDWACPDNGLYECYDLKRYFENSSNRAFLVKIENELAGFVLLKEKDAQSHKFWEMSEFFILGKFQNHGVGAKVAFKIWNMHPGFWEVTVIPENKLALSFWRKTISKFTHGNYTENVKEVDYDQHQPKRYFFNFCVTF